MEQKLASSANHLLAKPLKGVSSKEILVLQQNEPDFLFYSKQSLYNKPQIKNSMKNTLEGTASHFQVLRTLTQSQIHPSQKINSPLIQSGNITSSSIGPNPKEWNKALNDESGIKIQNQNRQKIVTCDPKISTQSSSGKIILPQMTNLKGNPNLKNSFPHALERGLLQEHAISENRLTPPRLSQAREQKQISSPTTRLRSIQQSIVMDWQQMMPIIPSNLNSPGSSTQIKINKHHQHQPTKTSFDSLETTFYKESPALSTSFYFSSQRQIELPGESRAKLAVNLTLEPQSIIQKKLISHSTNNSLLPPSLNKTQNQKSRGSSIQTENNVKQGSLTCMEPELDQKIYTTSKSSTFALHQNNQIYRMSSMKHLRKVLDCNPEESSSLKIPSSNILEQEKKKEILFSVDQTQEQQQFEADLLLRIRQKRNRKFYSHTVIPQNQNHKEYSTITHPIEEQQSNKIERETSLTSQLPTCSASVSSFTSFPVSLSKVKFQGEFKEVINKFQQFLLTSIETTSSSLNQMFLYYYNDHSQQQPFLAMVMYLFETALSASIKRDTEAMILRKFPYQIPTKLFQLLKGMFRIITSEIINSQQSIVILKLFEVFIDAQYENLNLKPQDMLDELGGKVRLQLFFQELQNLVCKKLKTQSRIPEKYLNEIGLALLQNPGGSSQIDTFFNDFKRSRNVSDSDLSTVKYTLYKFLFEDEQIEGKSKIPFEQETKLSFLKAFEFVRFKYFESTMSINTDQITEEIAKSLKTRKPLLDYFACEEEDGLNFTDGATEGISLGMVKQNNNAMFFLLTIMDCFFYRIAPSTIGKWLIKNLSKPADSTFYSYFKSLFVEHFKQRKMSEQFIQGIDMKLFWIKTHANITSFDGVELLQKIDEVLVNTSSWITAMIDQKQLTKYSKKIITQIRELSFLKYFLITSLSEDTYFAGDTVIMLEMFNSSADAVHYQLRGLKRIFLMMKYKNNAANEMTEFFTNTFTNSLLFTFARR